MQTTLRPIVLAAAALALAGGCSTAPKTEEARSVGQRKYKADSGGEEDES